jgi:programmed cell death protein 5
MDDLEAIRQRKLRELQQRQAAPQDGAADAAHQAAQQEAAIESLLQQILDDEARQRLTRIRMSRPELADALSRQLIALAQSGRLPKRLTDEELRAILARLSPPDRDIKITRK